MVGFIEKIIPNLFLRYFPRLSGDLSMGDVGLNVRR